MKSKQALDDDPRFAEFLEELENSQQLRPCSKKNDNTVAWFFNDKRKRWYADWDKFTLFPTKQTTVSWL